MGQLRDRMAQDLKLKGVCPATIRNYLLYCRKFAAFFMRSPEELGAADVRAFLLHQIEVEQLAYASYRQVYAALKFLYSVTLGRPGEVSRIPFPKRQPGALPKVLTVNQLTAFFAAFRKAKYRALFMTCYAAGLRLGEACHLRVQDIDSARMVIHVRTGKGGKERLTVLSSRLLEVLRAYWRLAKPSVWLFPGIPSGKKNNAASCPSFVLSRMRVRHAPRKFCIRSPGDRSDHTARECDDPPGGRCWIC